jgi:hypothetical protein
MEILKYNQFNESVKYNIFKDNKSRSYYFKINEFDYKVTITKNESNIEYPWIGFKAKHKADKMEIYYDMDIITNNSLYQLTEVIKDILNKDYDTNKNNIKGYTFSTKQNKKGNQRIILYKRYLQQMNWNIEETGTPNHFIIHK